MEQAHGRLLVVRGTGFHNGADEHLNDAAADGGEGHGDEAKQQGDAGTIDNTGEHAAAIAVRAQREIGARAFHDVHPVLRIGRMRRYEISEDGDEDEERPDEDGVKAEINEPDIVGRTHGEGDRREDASRQPISARIYALTVDHEKADRASCGLRNVAEQDVEDDEL